MLQEGLSYPTKGEKWIGRMTIGGVLGYVSFLLVPLLASYGYQIEVLSSTASGERVPPDFEGWLGLTWNGFKASVVAFVYVVGPNLVLGTVLLVLFVVLGGLGRTELANPDTISEMGLVLLGIAGVVTVFVELLIVYLLPAAMVNFAAEGSMRSAFGLPSVFGLAASGPYLLATLLVPVVGFVVLVLSLTVVGTVLAPAVAFWGAIATTRTFGIAYREVHDVPLAAPAPTGTRPRTAARAAGPTGESTAADPGTGARADRAVADEQSPRPPADEQPSQPPADTDPAEVDEEPVDGRPKAGAETVEDADGTDSSVAAESTPKTVTFEEDGDAEPTADSDHAETTDDPEGVDDAGGLENRGPVGDADPDEGPGGSDGSGDEPETDDEPIEADDGDGSDDADGADESVLSDGDDEATVKSDGDDEATVKSDSGGETGTPGRSDDEDERRRDDATDEEDDSDTESNGGPPRI